MALSIPLPHTLRGRIGQAYLHILDRCLGTLLILLIDSLPRLACRLVHSVLGLFIRFSDPVAEPSAHLSSFPTTTVRHLLGAIHQGHRIDAGPPLSAAKLTVM